MLAQGKCYWARQVEKQEYFAAHTLQWGAFQLEPSSTLVLDPRKAGATS